MPRMCFFRVGPISRRRSRGHTRARALPPPPLEAGLLSSRQGLLPSAWGESTLCVVQPSPHQHTQADMCLLAAGRIRYKSTVWDWRLQSIAWHLARAAPRLASAGMCAVAASAAETSASSSSYRMPLPIVYCYTFYCTSTDRTQSQQQTQIDHRARSSAKLLRSFCASLRRLPKPFVPER